MLIELQFDMPRKAKFLYVAETFEENGISFVKKLHVLHAGTYSVEPPEALECGVPHRLKLDNLKNYLQSHFPDAKINVMMLSILS